MIASSNLLSLAAEEYINEVKVVVVDLLYLFIQDAASAVQQHLHLAKEVVAAVNS
jgi:hypothetical protein